jgi:heme-degrading monooxygenase HmoA
MEAEKMVDRTIPRVHQNRGLTTNEGRPLCSNDTLEVKEDFERWTDSQAFMDAHANTPPKEAFTGPSKLEVHEIIAESPAGTNLS